MKYFDKKFSRRSFLKTGILAAGAFAINPWEHWSLFNEEWPDAEQLGRNCTDGIINLRAHPSENSAQVGRLYEDTVVVWLREVIGEAPGGVF
ncbi:MAG: hypothetical protein LWX83_17180, partial [Anaerolineae bacterium]|nr:hypothetical protein [Anaerolineae bacterium]